MGTLHIHVLISAAARPLFILSVCYDSEEIDGFVGAAGGAGGVFGGEGGKLVRTAGSAGSIDTHNTVPSCVVAPSTALKTGRVAPVVPSTATCW